MNSYYNNGQIIRSSANLANPNLERSMQRWPIDGFDLYLIGQHVIYWSTWDE
ncbi:hypothetical protein P4S72_25480 [Vibrio sp. PP-XX7]